MRLRFNTPDRANSAVLMAHPTLTTVNVIKKKLKNLENYLMGGIDLMICEARQRILAIGYY